MAEQEIKQETKAGKAYLVGAGPGRADLITVRGLKLLKQAEVVMYDRLIPQELLQEARPEAEMIFVGKGPDRHVMEQEEITQLLVEQVRAGKQVVRLKGGDPLVFGRGGEEILALAEAGLAYEVVPGISSALAGPAYAGIPVTHRDTNHTVTFLTGHDSSGVVPDKIDWGGPSVKVTASGKKLLHIPFRHAANQSAAEMRAKGTTTSARRRMMPAEIYACNALPWR